ncbi:MAG TPA: helix-turn-helix domain-containing protein [Candidatus Binatia bacterium]|jgi:transcriptional regulator GlxA family with amidase domain|nr:helix-turn-helix domain-containing protein [Candidatus Binatia bacterium]
MTEGRLLQIQDWEQLAREAVFQPAIMAALCPISLRQMERFFLQHFDQTPSEWVRGLRCRLARQFISEGWSSKAVILELGFVDGSHLGREFRRFYGVPPQTFAPFRSQTPARQQACVSPGSRS